MRDDMIKIAPTVEIYNRPTVQKHPVFHGGKTPLLSLKLIV